MFGTAGLDVLIVMITMIYELPEEWKEYIKKNMKSLKIYFTKK